MGPLLPRMGLGLAVPLAVPDDTGLGPLAIAVPVALIVGAPASALSWVDPPPPPPLAALTRIGMLGFLAAVVASVGDGIAPLGCWLAVWALMRFGARWALPGLLGAALATAAVTGTGALATGPWTLLEPHFGSALPSALATGLLLPLCGLGAWDSVPGRPPGTLRLPWAVAGVGALACLALVVARAGAFETAGNEGAVALTVSAFAAAALAGLLATERAPDPKLVVAGIAWTAWFEWAPAALAFWVTAVVPFIVAGANAWLFRSTRKPVAALAALVAAVAAVFGAPDLPARPWDAAMVAMTAVLCVWVAGTQSVLSHARVTR